MSAAEELNIVVEGPRKRHLPIRYLANLDCSDTISPLFSHHVFYVTRDDESIFRVVASARVPVAIILQLHNQLTPSPSSSFSS